MGSGEVPPITTEVAEGTAVVGDVPPGHTEVAVEDNPPI